MPTQATEFRSRYWFGISPFGHRKLLSPISPGATPIWVCRLCRYINLSARCRVCGSCRYLPAGQTFADFRDHARHFERPMAILACHLQPFAGKRLVARHSHFPKTSPRTFVFSSSCSVINRSAPARSDPGGGTPSRSGRSALESTPPHRVRAE